MTSGDMMAKLGKNSSSYGLAALALAFLLSPAPAIAETNQPTLTGIPVVVDGDTIDLAGARIRLQGIDAPAEHQTCTTSGKKWLCGWEASNALAFIVARHWVTCSLRGKDRFGFEMAVCRTGPIELNAYMVENGWARAVGSCVARPESPLDF